MMNTGTATARTGCPTWVWFFAAGLVGLATSIAFVYITQYYTAGSCRPVREIAEASKTGPATNIITGTAVGFETTFVTAITIGIALIAQPLARRRRRTSSTRTAHDVGGIFGTAVATMGMLMTTAYILAMDTFGPITDNAGGIAEFSRAEAGAREITDRLDAVGNTTKALTKGYAIASASLAAFLLFCAYIDKVNLILSTRSRPATARGSCSPRSTSPTSTSSSPRSSARCSCTSSARSPSARSARRRSRSSSRCGASSARCPGSWTTRQRPDYARVVDITTRPPCARWSPRASSRSPRRSSSACSSATRPSPGFLMVGTIAGVLLATVLNNGGGAWDNAKKYIESGNLKDDDGNVLGKGTDAHAAAVVGDTVGDPFKDTAGPSLHVLVKLLATITLVLAPLFIR